MSAHRIDRERWIRLGPVELGVSLPAPIDRRLTRSAVVQRVVKPLMRRRRDTNSITEVAVQGEINDPLPARRPVPEALTHRSRELIDRLAGIDWYHSIDLGDGVVTPGLVDYRKLIPRQLPGSVAGKRCLDVQTRDGFWAFEMERRGAREVVAAGVGKETSAGFRLAHDVLRSQVKRETIDVYDLSPKVLGQFDVVFVSDLLLQLRDPQLALDRVRAVCRETLYIVDSFNPGLEPFGARCLAEYAPRLADGDIGWLMSLKTIKRMLRVSGFETVEDLDDSSDRIAAHASGRRRYALRAGVPSQAAEGSRLDELLSAR